MNIILPILRGRLKGKKWVLNAGGKIARLLLSTYEIEQTSCFEKMIKEGNTILDIGASIGYYTLLSSYLVGNKGKVFAFEPDPTNLFYLEKHITLNRLTNVTLIKSAVSDNNGFLYFEKGSGSGTGHISSTGNVKVNTITLDEFIRNHQIIPDFIKIDVEGAEFQVLSGAKTILNEYHPTLFLSTHGKDIHQKCCLFLTNLNYQIQPLIGQDLENATELVCAIGNEKSSN